jgi:Bax protein
MTLIRRLIKRKILVLALLGMIFTANAQNKKYIENHKLLATVLSGKYGIPASVILAVAAVESSGGVGPAAKVLNNHFGMEGKNNIVTPNGKKSRYKQYNNVVASYIDFCDVISRKRFYPALKDNEDPKAWLKAISKSGYSEEPEQWEFKVFSVLQKNKL